MYETRLARYRFVAFVAGLLFLAPLARADMFSTAPSFKIGTAELLSPDAANLYYGAATVPSNSVGTTALPQEIVELARALNYDVDSIYQFVRNNVDIAWMYGLQKGALGAMIDRSGTAFDQAQLMYQLLTASPASFNYNPTYVVGTISLTGAQFYDWSGITSATAACQLLSSGGIPAVINGSTSAACAYGAATVSTIVVGHIWLRVNIGGQNYDFDPSYKAHSFKAGLNLASVAGLTAGQALTQASSGMSTGTASTLGYVQNLNTESLGSTLQTYGTNLLTYIQNNLSGGELEDVVGGSEIVRVPTTILRQSPLPYKLAENRYWTLDIPDPYRTSLRVQIGKWNDTAPTLPIVIDKILFVDEIYGRKLVFRTNFSAGGFSSTLAAVDEAATSVTIATFSDGQNPLLSLGDIILTADHPYAATAGPGTAGGSYMDVTVRKVNLRYATPLTILHGWGDVGRGLVDKLGSRSDSVLDSSPAGCPETCDSAYHNSKGDGRREQVVPSWLAQFSRAARLHAAIAKSTFAHHHSIGVVAADTYVNTACTGTPCGALQFSVIDSYDRVDIESGFSLTSNTAVAADRRAALHAIAATGEALEGSVLGQIADLPDTSSTATRFDWGNRPPAAEDLSGGAGPRRFYRFSSAADATQAPNVVKVEGAATSSGDGIHPDGEPEIGPTEFGGRRGAVTGAVTQYAQAGFDVVASEEAFLGPGQRGGAYMSTAPTRYTHVPSRQRGGALVATRYVGGEPVEIAHVVMANDVNAKGGGGGTQPSYDATYDPSKAADILRARFVDRSKVVGVDLQTGQVTYTSPASLTVGNGAFPYSLSASLIWRGGDRRTEIFGPTSHVEPQVPWSTNWNNTLTVSGSGLEAMGEGDVRATAGTVAAFLAAQDIYKATPSSAREVAAVLVNAWWSRQLSGNVVTANVGADTRQFVKLVNGQWLGTGAGSLATLTQTGARAPYTEAPCSAIGPQYVTARGWNYASVSYKVTSAQGDDQNFAFWKTRYTEAGAQGWCANPHGFRLSSWVFPYGMTVNLVYAEPNPGFSLPELTEVNNTLGRKIRFVQSGRGGFDNGLAGADLRTVTVSETSTAGIATTVHTDPSSVQTKFEYLDGRQYLLQKVTTADSSLPALQYTYDGLRRVKEARDAVASRGGARNPYEFFLADGASAERLDPSGGRYKAVFDRHHRPISYTDELGRAVAITSDGRGRVTQYTYPEGDQERLEYDDRNNPTKLIKVGKICSPTPCTPLTLTVQADWNTTWNKPNWILDARGNQTDFVYYASGNGRSLVNTAKRSAPVGATPRPTYTFTYNARGQVLDATDPTSLVIRNAYNPTNGNLDSTTRDPTGLNALTGFIYDANGDATSSTDPRLFVTERVYDNNRRNTVVKHHNGNIGAVLLAAERTNFDVLGQVTSEESGTTFSGTTITAWQTRKATTYTPTGKVDTEKNGANDTTTYLYDPMDRVQQVADPLNRLTRFAYDLAGQTLTETRAYGTPLQQVYATYTYTPNGQRQTVKDANSNLTTFEYDSFDRLARLRFPVATAGANASSTTDDELYTYDENGNLKILTKRDNQVINYTYDPLDRLTIKDVPGGTANDVYSGYDLAGRQAYAHFGSAGGSGIEYSYDSAGRRTNETEFGRAMILGYDAAGNRNRVTWPDTNFVSYTFDAMNRMTEVRQNSTTVGTGVLGTYAYDAFSRRDGVTRANGAGSDYNYDAASRLQTLNQDFASTTQDLQLGFGYTLASQLQTRSSSNPLFDWTTVLPSRIYAVNGLNQYTTVSGSAYTHDLNGNLTSDGSRLFGYDVENRLTSVSGSASLTLTYDPLGRLRQTVGGATTQFLYEGDRLVAEYDGAGALLRRYVHGPGVDDPMLWYEGSGLTDKRWLHSDERGSVIATSDTSGVATAYAYGPFGEPAAWSGSRFRYAGQTALPEVQLYYYKARVYDPMLGRFLQTDPIGYEDDFNLYAYVRNDPLNQTDPSGTEGGCVISDTCESLDFSWVAPAAAATADFLDSVDEVVTGFGPAGMEEHMVAVPLIAGLRALTAEGKAEAIVYHRINKANLAEKPYIGRAKSEARFAERQREHARGDRKADYEFKELDRTEPGQPLRQAEQQQITEHGGPTNKSNPNGGTSNRRNEIAQPPAKPPMCTRTGSRIPKPC